MDQYILVFDGGSIGNPGRAYGSARLKAPGTRAGTPIRYDLGDGTNNQAEYRALIEGFRSLLGTLEADGILASSIAVEVRGDSRLVIHQMDGSWKIKSVALRDLHDEAYELSRRFKEVKYLHQSRAATLQALGH